MRWEKDGEIGKIETDKLEQDVALFVAVDINASLATCFNLIDVFHIQQNIMLLIFYFSQFN